MKLSVFFKIFAIGLPLLLAYSCKNKTIEKVYPVTGSIVIYDPELLTVIDTSSKIEILGEGFIWSEGPLWLESLQKLIFTDVPANRAYSWDVENGIQTYLEPSGFTAVDGSEGQGANGLALDHDGGLILCQHGDRTLAKMASPIEAPMAEYIILAQKYNDKLLNSPNDLCIAKNGDIFFTDPPYGLSGLDDDPAKELTFNGVYRLKKDGSLILIDSVMTKPNGIALSMDEKFLFVANSDPEAAQWVRFSLDGDLNITEKIIFADKTSDVASLKGLPDGLKINKSDYIFASGPGGILIFSPDARHLGTVLTGQATANCALNTDEKYLYMTAHSYLMRVKLK